MNSLKMQETYQSLECPGVGKSRKKKKQHHKIRHLAKASCRLHAVSTSLSSYLPSCIKSDRVFGLKSRVKAAEVRLNPHITHLWHAVEIYSSLMHLLCNWLVKILKGTLTNSYCLQHCCHYCYKQTRPDGMCQSQLKKHDPKSSGQRKRARRVNEGEMGAGQKSKSHD